MYREYRQRGYAPARSRYIAQSVAGQQAIRKRRLSPRKANPRMPRWLLPAGIAALVGLAVLRNRQQEPCCEDCAKTGGHCGG